MHGGIFPPPETSTSVLCEMSELKKKMCKHARSTSQRLFPLEVVRVDMQGISGPVFYVREIPARLPSPHHVMSLSLV